MYRVVTQLAADPAHGSFAQPSSSVIIHCISKFGRGCVSLSSDSSLDHSLHLIIHLQHRTRPFLSRHISRNDLGATTGASRHAVHAPSGGTSTASMPPTFPIFPSRATNRCINRAARMLSEYVPLRDHIREYILNAKLSPSFRVGVSVPLGIPSAISDRRCSKSAGISIFTGQTSRQAPHKLDA